LGIYRLKLNAGYQQNLRKEYGNPEDENENGLFFDLKTITYNVQLILPEKKEWHTTIGLSGMYQVNANKGTEAIVPAYHFFDIGGFIYTQRFFKKTTWSGGLRFDNRSLVADEMYEGTDLKFAYLKKSFSDVSASIGFSYEPAEFISIKGNIARGYRAPNIAELGSNGAHEGTNRYEYGEKDLSSETTLQLDGGFRADYDHFSFGLSTYYNRVNDFIFYRKLLSASGGDSLVNVDGENLEAFRFDQYDAKLSGLEMTFDIHPHPLDWLHFENSVSWVRGQFTEKIGGSDNLPLIPAPRLVSELKANFKKTGKALRNVYIKAEMDHNFKQNKPFFAFDTETATAAYTLLHAGFGADIVNKKGVAIFNIHFAGSNLTDAAYQNHLSRLKYTDRNLVTGRNGVFNIGRNFSLKVNVPFSFQSR
jgi:iron complex outermembrane receptor protein